jgi:hypothetical protein
MPRACFAFAPIRFKHLFKAAALTAALPALAADDSDDGRSVVVLPGAFYSQETSVGFALYGSATLPLRGTGPSTWPSTVAAAVIGTVNGQASVAWWNNVYLGESNDWSIETESVVEHFPTNYYGVGPASEPSFQVFTRRQVRSDEAVRHQVVNHVFLGVADHLALVDVVDVQAPTSTGDGPVVWTTRDRLGDGTVVGEDGSRVHGLGALGRLDTRDNNQSTRRGALVDGELSGYAPIVGSSATFGLARLDVRGFVPVGSGATVGVQWLTVLGVGDVPFTSMPELGGDDQLRGMFQGRFRDQGASSAQVELRHPVFWRFRAVVFGAAGQVFPSLGEALALPPHWSVGGGLRFELDEVSHSVLRLDVGAGPDGTGFIFNFGEAF